MVPAWDNSGTLLGSTGADITPVINTHAAGDLLILLAAARSDAVTLLTPSGWTLIAGPNDQGTTWRWYAFYRIALTAAETNPLCDWSAVTGDKYGVVFVVKGSVTWGLPYSAISTGSGTADPGTISTHTNLEQDALIICCGLVGDDVATSATITATDPATFTLRSYTTIITGADAGCWFADAPQSTVGATGTITVDFNGAPTVWNGIVLSIRPNTSKGWVL